MIDPRAPIRKDKVQAPHKSCCRRRTRAYGAAARERHFALHLAVYGRYCGILQDDASAALPVAVRASWCKWPSPSLLCCRDSLRTADASKLGSLHALSASNFPSPAMSLVSGPGRAGVSGMPAELQPFVDKHVHYIQSLDT